jgi:predicted nuclease of predicted toxin-antitoxin system
VRFLVDAQLPPGLAQHLILRALSRHGGPPIVWVRLGNTTNRALLAVFDLVLPGILQAIARGETVVQIPHVST